MAFFGEIQLNFLKILLERNGKYLILTKKNFLYKDF